MNGFSEPRYDTSAAAAVCLERTTTNLLYDDVRQIIASIRNLTHSY
jgi:hypothetical protein